MSITHLQDLPFIKSTQEKSQQLYCRQLHKNRLHTQTHIVCRKFITWIYCSNTFLLLSTTSTPSLPTSVSLHFIKASLSCLCNTHTQTRIYNLTTHTFSSCTCVEVYHFLHTNVSSLDQAHTSDFMKKCLCQARTRKNK